MLFFDKYDVFLRTSSVGNWRDRLNARYLAIIEENRGVLNGATVLDLGSHDGRWTFAAIDAGANFVTGIEARAKLVNVAERNMRELGVGSGRYRLLAGDMFALRAAFEDRCDVVLCLGILYHTARHVELIELMSRTRAATIIIDTMFANRSGCLSIIHAEHSEPSANGFDNTGVRDGKVLVSLPTLDALTLMFEHFGYSIRRVDWHMLIAALDLSPNLTSDPSASNPVGDYAKNIRGTFIATKR